MLDTARSVETPEGIELGLRVAGPVPRTLAWLIDISIRLVLYSLLAFLLGDLGDFGAGVYLLALFVLEWFYPVVFEVYGNGATPGKRLLGLRVINDDGTPVRWSGSVVRNLMRGVDFLPFGYALGLLSMLFHPDFKRIGDLAAGTLVVYVERHDHRGTAAAAGAGTAPPWALTPDEQRTLIDFAERRARITPERAEELARAAGPLVAGSKDPAARLQAFAGWLAGER